MKLACSFVAYMYTVSPREHFSSSLLYAQYSQGISINIIPKHKHPWEIMYFVGANLASPCLHLLSNVIILHLTEQVRIYTVPLCYEITMCLWLPKWHFKVAPRSITKKQQCSVVQSVTIITWIPLQGPLGRWLPTAEALGFLPVRFCQPYCLCTELYFCTERQQRIY